MPGCHSDLVSIHGAPVGDCVACHMQRRQSRDSGHSAFTDHRIAIQPTASESARAIQSGRLKPWREPAPMLSQRILGIAYARRAEIGNSADDAKRALRLLTAAAPAFAGDPDILGGLGMSLMLTGAGREGARKLEQAIAAEPDNPLRYPAAAAARWQLGQDTRAIEILREAIRVDPYYVTAYHMIAHIFAERKELDDARSTWEAYLRLVPSSVNARLALRSMVSE